MYGDQSQVTIAAIHNLASTTSELGDYPEAIALAAEELRLRKETVGEHGEATVVAMCRLGVIYQESGDCQQARILHENVVDLASESFPRSRLQIDAMRLLFDDLRASKEKKDWLEAMRLAQEIQDMAKEVLDPDDPLAVRLRRLRWMGPLLRYINWPDARKERAEWSIRGDLAPLISIGFRSQPLSQVIGGRASKDGR
jgi:Tetratricopeptide repeat